MLWSKLGINYGNDIIGGNPYSSSQVSTDLTYLKAIGITNLRLALPSYNNATDITNMQAVLATAKQMGFYCIWGVSHGSTITSSNWATIKTALLAQALSSASWTYPPDEWQIDNEATLGHDGTIASTTIRTDMKTMATTVKGYATWKVNFGESEFDQEGNDNIATWNTAGIGNFDFASFHIYNTYANFQTKINLIITDFGVKGYASEFGDQHDFISGSYTELQWQQHIAQRIAFLKTTSIQSAYVFTYRMLTDDWALLLTNGNYRIAFPSVIGQRSWFFGNPNSSIKSQRSLISRTSTISRPSVIARQVF